MAAVTRLSLIAMRRPPYGSFAGKVEAKLIAVIGPTGIYNFDTPATGTYEFNDPPIGTYNFDTPETGEYD